MGSLMNGEKKKNFGKISQTTVFLVPLEPQWHQSVLHARGTGPHSNGIVQLTHLPLPAAGLWESDHRNPYWERKGMSTYGGGVSE